MENLEQFLNTLEKLKDTTLQYRKKSEKIRESDFNKKRESTNSMQDDNKRNLNKIEDNLKSITSCKHFIHKAQDSMKTKSVGLPLSNIYHETMINFVGETAMFINTFGAKDFKRSSDSDENLGNVVTSIQCQDENFLKAIKREKMIVDDIESTLKNTHTISNYYNELMQGANGSLDCSISGIE